MTGEVLLPDLYVEIPAERRAQAADAAAILGEATYFGLPFVKSARPVLDDPAELAFNRAWRPQLAITGMTGLPTVANSSAVMHPELALKLSIRLPPTLDPELAARELKNCLEADPPYGAHVCFDVHMASAGWHAPALAPWLAASLDNASLNAFGRPSAFMGGGGGIPFLSMLGERFPSTQFVATGVLGPQSNAHGPNEFLHLPTAKRITAALAHLLHECQ